jgi:hypothetical protein
MLEPAPFLDPVDIGLFSVYVTSFNVRFFNGLHPWRFRCVRSLD